MVLAVEAMPLTYLVVAAGLATRAEPDLERAARASGAGPVAAFRTVTLPLLRPVIACAAAIAFVLSVTSFGVPAVLGIPAQMIGVYLTARTAASIVSNLFWGRISDRMGNRRLLQIANALGLCMPLTALGIGLLGSSTLAVGPWLPWAYALVFVVSGAFAAASGIARTGYLLDVAPSAQRSLYLGFSNSLLGVIRFAALASGLIVDWAGFSVLMAMSAGFYGLAFVLALAMPEPRDVPRPRHHVRHPRRIA